MRIAIIHGWLVTYAGAERVLEQMLACYPDADLFLSLVDFLPTDRRDFIRDKPVATSLLKGWIELAKESALPPLVKVAYTMQNHWDGILRWFESHRSNGILEGFNSLIQSAKAKARGYRSHKNFINMAYLILGKLDLGLPT